MMPPVSRRRFVRDTAAVSLATLLPGNVFSQAPAAQTVVVHPDSAIGTIRPELHSHFAEHLGSCVYGGLWVGQNSPIPNVNGYRKAAVDYLKELGIPVLRWPGGCYADNYHWRDGIGPVPKRPRRVNANWANAREDGSFGLHEFIGLCRLIGAEPYLSVNVGSGTPQEALDWLEYCNFPGGTTLSDERIANGAAEPFRVRYWGIGNEAWGCGGQMTPDHYADVYRTYANYFKTFGGTQPFLIACGPSSDNAAWTKGFYDRMAGARSPAGFAMHFYEMSRQLAPTEFTVEAMNQQLAIFQRVEQAVINQRALIDGYNRPQRSALILDEWGVWDGAKQEEQQRYGQLWQQSTMRSAVAAGLGLNIFNRQADKLYMCNIAQIVNVLQSVLLTDGPQGKNCIRTSTYWAFSLFRPHRSKTAVKVDSDASDPLGLSVSASTSGSELVLSLVNPKHDAELRIECSIAGRTAARASAQLLHSADLNAANTFDQPDTLTPKPHPVETSGQTVRISLPPLSVATVTVQMA